MVEKKTTKSGSSKNGKNTKAKEAKPKEAKSPKETKTNKKTKEVADSPKEIKAEEQPKSHKKFWIILCSIVSGLAVVGLATWGIISLVLETQPLEQDWAQTYYVYLDEHPLDPELKDSEGEKIADAEEYEVTFYDVEGVSEPVMTVNYVAHDINYVTYYWVEGADGIKRALLYDPSEIELLYNLEEQKSDYYIHYEKDNTDYYKKLSDEIASIRDNDESEHVKEVPEYKFGEKDVVAVTDKDGKEHSMTKFEQTFVEVEDDTKTTTLPVNYDKKELKNVLKDESYEYKVLQEVAAKHAEMIRKVAEDVEKRKNEIAAVEKENAEIEAARKAEEERKRAEEEAKKGIQLEGYTIAYGTYLMDSDIVGEEYAGQNTLVLKPNGVCTYGGKACTYTFGQSDFAQDASSNGRDVHKAIIITVQGSFGNSLFAYGNNELGDGDIEHYTYAGY